MPRIVVLHIQKLGTAQITHASFNVGHDKEDLTDGESCTCMVFDHPEAKGPFKMKEKIIIQGPGLISELLARQTESRLGDHWIVSVDRDSTTD